ncbi:sulfonate ABC transporter substrate-binding protein [Bosea caraganae]|uniref:Sulfonate ABC transporter substrate-binding protein n=1 Tax=Bosea caraganae TaxID=2763117 RepID=A0A370L8U4_9HYPH|nr:ABC transporter substrate-binding protein [Bosea caraganae]RDJ26810.1 sulfonate ABC transporter substrate-binding protein [Bosea caraganae]RDJ30696.1 sulfonate ABC transporter substrate-binding protein [Bosea caraganae]
MRRLLKYGVLAGLAAATLTAPAGAQDKASLRLNWQLLGFHAPFYYGVEKGYYKDAGIELSVSEGRGGAATAQAVGAGSDAFGLVDAGTVIVSAAKGIPIKSVMSLMNSGVFAVVARKESGITKAKDLEGKTIAVTAGDALTQLFPAVVTFNKLDESKIKFVNVDAASKVIAVLEKRADATLGSIDAQSFVMEAKGVPASVLSYDDLGVKLVGFSIVVNDQTAASKPDLVKRFVKATRKSFEEALKNPDAAVAAAVKVKPELDPKVVRQQMDVSLAKLESANTAGKPLGVGAVADWDNTLNLLKTYQKLETTKTGSDFFTNAYAE